VNCKLFHRIVSLYFCLKVRTLFEDRSALLSCLRFASPIGKDAIWFLLASSSRRFFRLAIDDGSEISWFRLMIRVSSLTNWPISSGSRVKWLLLKIKMFIKIIWNKDISWKHPMYVYHGTWILVIQYLFQFVWFKNTEDFQAATLYACSDLQKVLWKQFMIRIDHKTFI